MALDMQRGTVTAVLGPTNTGKTHYAIERMLGRRTGVIGFPLRLLAREVFDKIVRLKGPRLVALITGEEKIVPPDARYFVCTVESMPVDWGADFLAVDEIQLCADLERGHVFTDRLLNARGLQETLFLGAETMRGRIAQLVPGVRFQHRERMSQLRYVGPKRLARLPGRSAAVAFSTDNVYAMAELIRRQKGGAAVVMGALSPRTRNAQVELFQNGDVDHLVATDAIGMGLNLDLNAVFFAGTAKFDGRRHRALMPQELGQIAGRAGRGMSDGNFGLTGEARALDAEVVQAIEEHHFEPVGPLQWRNSALELATPEALIHSLEAPPPVRGLVRARDSDDLTALRMLSVEPDIIDVARGRNRVRLLWDVCQIPDFRKTLIGEHVELIRRIYGFLTGPRGTIPDDWLAAQVRRVDRTDGDIDTLSKRLAFVRTWTYAANRAGWLDDGALWRETTRAVEDRLSDALHQRLTQRFVDRRTSVLLRRLKQKEDLVATVEKGGDVMVEGEFVGRIEGLKFRPDTGTDAAQTRMLQAASAQPVAAALTQRVETLYAAPDKDIDFTEQGGIVWDNVVVGRITAGADVLSPGVVVYADDLLDASSVERALRRLQQWLDRKVAALFEPLIAMRDDAALTGMARGVAFQIIESLGILPRAQAAQDIKALEQEQRAALRRHGIRFGQHTVFSPALLKPAPTRLRLVLWSVHRGHDEAPSPPPPGLVTIPTAEGTGADYYAMAGYRRAGARAIRIDMLERLADLIRPMDARQGFEATPDMLSISGLTLEQFADLMSGLGYRAERGERAKLAKTTELREMPGADGMASEAVDTETGVTEAAVAHAPESGQPESAADPAAETPPAATEQEPDAPVEATTDSSAEAQDEAPSAPPETTDEAMPDTAAPSEKAAEQEIFYLFRSQPRNRRPRRDTRDDVNRGERRERPKRDAGEGQGAKPEADSEKRGKRPPRKRKPDDRNAPGGKGRPRKGKREDGAAKPRDFSARPERKPRAVDPDSPFAVLKQLVDKD